MDKVRYLRKRPQRKWKLILLIILIFSVSLLFVGRWVIMQSGGLFIRTTTTRIGQLQSSHTLDALAIRREEAYFAPLPGRISLLTNSGQRVSGGTVVVELRDEKQEAEIKPQLQGSREDLRNFELNALESIFHLDELLTSIDEQIRQGSTDGDALEKQRANLLAQREDQVKHLAQQRDGLLGQTENYLKNWQKAIQHITVPRPGVIRYQTDGLEGVLTPERALEFNREDLLALSPRIQSRQYGEVVPSGTPLFKVIDNHQFFLLAFLPAMEFVFNKGQRVWVRIPGMEELPGRVHDIGPAAHHQGVLFVLDNYHSDFDLIRQVKIEVISNRVKGTVLPKSVLHESRGRTGVYVKTQQGPLFQTVEVLAEDGDLLCLGGIPQGVEVITRGLWR